MGTPHPQSRVSAYGRGFHDRAAAGRSATAALASCLAALAAAPAAAVPGPTVPAAAVPGPAGPSAAQEAPVDTAGLGAGPYATLRTLVEKSIFKVNVLTAEIRFGPAPAAEIERLARAGDGAGARRDSLALAGFEASDALVRIDYLRGFDADRMREGILRNLRGAVRAGWMSEEEHERIGRVLPEWLGFLEGRGVREGDAMWIRVRGDTVSTVYRDRSGGVLTEWTAVDPLRRRAVLGRYFAPGSDFLDGLLDSLPAP